MPNDAVLDLVSNWLDKTTPSNSPIAQKLAQLSPEIIAQSLRSRLALLAVAHKFEVGQLVRWKPGMRHLAFPLPGRPAIVVETLDQPVVNQFVGPESPYFSEVLDIRVGVIGDDGAFYSYHVPSVRFEPFTD